MGDKYSPRRDEAMIARARAVASGECTDERDTTVLSMAADIILEPYLKATKSSDKGDILSFRQIMRRKGREVYIGGAIDLMDVHQLSRQRNKKGHDHG